MQPKKAGKIQAARQTRLDELVPVVLNELFEARALACQSGTVRVDLRLERELAVQVLGEGLAQHFSPLHVLARQPLHLEGQKSSRIGKKSGTPPPPSALPITRS